jgi:opacity protein-like surface antigen
MEANEKEELMSRFTRVMYPAIALVLALACAGAAPASAQRGRGGLELTVFNGYYIASDLYTTGATVTGTQIGLENSYMYGARLGVDPNPRVGVEFAWTHAGSDLTLKNPPNTLPVGFDPGRINLNTYGLDFLFYQPTTNPRAKAYFTLGFGWTLTDPQIQSQSGATVDGNSLFNWNFGAGAKMDMNPKLALRLEGRWRVTDTAITTSSGVYCDYWGYCYSYASDWYSSGELTAGLTLKLGGSR